MPDFKYQYRKKFSESEFVELEKIELGWSFKSCIKRTALAIVGIALMFSKYTISLGILLLCLLLFLAFLPLLSRKNTKKLYQETPYWKEKLTFGIDPDEFWVSGESIEAKCKWKNLKVWKSKNGWLSLAANGIPKMYFPVEDLMKNNIYDDVLGLCKKYGVDFDNPSPQ